MRYGKKKVARRVARKLRRWRGKRYEPQRPWPIWLAYAAVLLAAGGAVWTLAQLSDFPSRVYAAIFIVPLAAGCCVAVKAAHWLAS